MLASVRLGGTALALLFATAAAADLTRTRIASAGDWAVYRVSEWDFPLDETRMIRTEACLAETFVTGGGVEVLIPAASAPAEIRGGMLVAIVSDRWDFPAGRGFVEIAAGQPSTITVDNAYFEKEVVTFSTSPTDRGSEVLWMVAERAEGVIGVENGQGQLFARFSSRGMAEALAEMNACGGLSAR